MEEWFKCKKCGQIFSREICTANRCPFCGHNSLLKVTLKDRNVSPTYTYAVENTLTQRVWMPYKRKTERIE